MLSLAVLGLVVVVVVVVKFGCERVGEHIKLEQRACAVGGGI
jgi:hypothetical protein